MVDAQPYIGLVRMHYHTWKDNAAGVKRSFKVEGEFYQQVEIDIDNEAYENLNVPPIMSSQRASILHDFHQVCVIMETGEAPLGATSTCPLSII